MESSQDRKSEEQGTRWSETVPLGCRALPISRNDEDDGDGQILVDKILLVGISLIALELLRIDIHAPVPEGWRTPRRALASHGSSRRRCLRRSTRSEESSKTNLWSQSIQLNEDFLIWKPNKIFEGDMLEFLQDAPVATLMRPRTSRCSRDWSSKSINQTKGLHYNRLYNMLVKGQDVDYSNGLPSWLLFDENISMMSYLPTFRSAISYCLWANPWMLAIVSFTLSIGWVFGLGMGFPRLSTVSRIIPAIS